MRRIKLLALALAAAIVLAVGVVSISAASTSDKPDHPARQLTVVERAITDSVVDTGAAGDSLGDILAFGNPIFDAANVKQIGRDQGYCIRTNVGESWECNWTVILDQGSLVVEGPFYDDLRDSQLAITGSTGDFRNVRGEMTLHSRNAAGTEFDFIYRLTP
jgi:allene oxide cyclase